MPAQPIDGPPRFHVVLHEPEIPNNTGNIGRTCVALGARLHLIHPFGFDLDEKAVRRAGLDYWPRLDLREHQSWADYLGRYQIKSEQKPWMLSTRGGVPFYEAELHARDHFVFGKESSGLPAEIIESAPDRCLRVPMAQGERSLNLATCVAVVLYEALRQCHARGELDAGAPS
ncbi:MAG: tRNA (cytidine(34)-2'-O)-methyltransferase [Planctomycetota bacterium]